MTSPKLALLFVLTASAVAHANPEVGVVVTGEATLQPQLANELELWAGRTGYKVQPAVLPPDAVNAIVDCFVIEDEGCARNVVDKRAKSEAVLYARVDVQAGSTAMEKDVSLVLSWFDRGKKPVTRKLRCEHCNEQKLRATADELAAAVASAAGKLGSLKCASDPPGADVKIADRKIGVTPLEHPLAPGVYKVVVVKERLSEETRDVTVVAGQTVNLDLGLHVTGGGEGKPSRLAPTVVMGAGAALLATGIVMIAIDQDPSPDLGRNIRNTGPSGVGFAIAGLAVTAGGYVWYRATGRRHDSPVAAATHDGAYIGWLRRF